MPGSLANLLPFGTLRERRRNAYAITFLYPISTNFLKPEVLEAVLNWDRANSLSEAMIASTRRDFHELPPVSVPTLGISSTNDYFMWESQMQQSSRFVTAQWQYERIEGAGHWFMLEQAEKTNHLLLDWLAKHP